MKYILFAILGAALIFAIGMSHAGATVFHHNRANDNKDTCYTPEEINGMQSDYEKIAAYTGENAEKFKKGIILIYSEQKIKMEQMPWVEIDAYMHPERNAVRFTIFDKVGDKICAAGGDEATEDEWNQVVKAAGLAPTASNTHLGFNPIGAP